ncbi:MAG: type IX secretion system sortase PorU [Sphingobacteriales bacterium]|nr:type IX secretion system sortase PorU [Sphingobacteriales bacterium]
MMSNMYIGSKLVHFFNSRKYIRLMLLPLLLALIANTCYIAPVLAQQNTSQQTHTETLDWKTIQPVAAGSLNNNDDTNINGEADLGSNAQPAALFAGAAFNYPQHNWPIYAKRLPVAYTGQHKISLTDAQYEALPLAYTPTNTNIITETIEPEIKTANDKGLPVVMVSFIPIRKNPASPSGYEKLTHFTLKISTTANQPNPNNPAKDPARIYTETSVLANGQYYRFIVNKDGVCRIDRNFLKQLGISTTVNFANFHIYGNGGGALPELAGAARTDDLRDNPLQINDQNKNGIFDDADYALFYAQGPDQWTYNPSLQRFEHQKHPYATDNSYFVGINSLPVKIMPVQAAPTQAPTQTATTFNDYYFHEAEKKNLIHSGREFYGEEFSAVTTQTFNFTAPNITPASTVTIKGLFAARSVGASSSFTLKAANKTANTPNIGTVTPGYEKSYARNGQSFLIFEALGDQIPVEVTYNKIDPTAVGWLDYLAVNVTRNLVFNTGQLLFRNVKTYQSGNDASWTSFVLSGNTTNVIYWDVTDPTNAVQLTPTANNSTVTVQTNVLRQFIAFDGTDFVTPAAIDINAGGGQIPNQNLHAVAFPDLIIITHPDFLTEAERLAKFHTEHNGYEVLLTTIQTVYNEFSSGTPDLTAIRDFVKMFYDRAENNPDKMPQFLTLFGDASYDYKNIEFEEGINQNFVPTFETAESIETIDTYCTDDYFAVLDDNEGNNLEDVALQLDIAVGRLPVHTKDQARQVVDKIINYATNTKTLGDWRTNFSLVADDEDGNLHLEDAELHANYLETNFPEYNVEKIYFDSYRQQTTPGGNRYPDVNSAINSRVFAGNLVMNYVGHGGESGWAHERVLGTGDIASWTNYDKLPLFITATCSFSRYDNPGLTSAGEVLITTPNGGSIGNVTTVRLVYASSNQRMNEDFLHHLFKPINGKMPAIGEVLRRGKNDAAITGTNNRKFVLLGDPAITLAYPQYQAVATTINSKPVGNGSLDTLKALSKVTITGEVRDAQNQRLNSFNGRVYPTIFDKRVNVPTLANDSKSPVTTFSYFRNIIFRGNVSVTNGEFAFSFYVPKDIAYQIGNGRLSLYAENGQTDAAGQTNKFFIGAIDNNAANDLTPPEVAVFINDESFIAGGTTNEDPVLIVKITDEFGINTVGNGIGHDITGVLNNDEKNVLVLNNFYKSSLDKYNEGSIAYPLYNLSPGLHQISVKCWDINNNSAKGYTEFVVVKDAKLALEHVLNYPNPFMDQTSFWFEHNRPGRQFNRYRAHYVVIG